MTQFKTGKQLPLFEVYEVKDGKTEQDIEIRKQVLQFNMQSVVNIVIQALILVALTIQPS